STSSATRSRSLYSFRSVCAFSILASQSTMAPCTWPASVSFFSKTCITGYANDSAAPHSRATRSAKKNERKSCRRLGQTNGKRRVGLFRGAFTPEARLAIAPERHGPPRAIAVGDLPEKAVSPKDRVSATAVRDRLLRHLVRVATRVRG